MEKVSIIFPVYNEEKRGLAEFLKEYISFFNNLKKKKILDCEFIAVLNACKDNSKGVAEQFKSNNFIILDFERAGKGFAVSEGFKNALEIKASSNMMCFPFLTIFGSAEEGLKPMLLTLTGKEEAPEAKTVMEQFLSLNLFKPRIRSWLKIPVPVLFFLSILYKLEQMIATFILNFFVISLNR